MFGTNYLSKLDKRMYTPTIYEFKNGEYYKPNNDQTVKKENALKSLMYSMKQGVRTISYSTNSSQHIYGIIDEAVRRFEKDNNFIKRLMLLKNKDVNQIKNFCFESYVALKYNDDCHSIQWTSDYSDVDFYALKNNRKVAVECKSRMFKQYYNKLFDTVSYFMKRYKSSFEQCRRVNVWSIILEKDDNNTRCKVEYALQKILKKNKPFILEVPNVYRVKGAYHHIDPIKKKFKVSDIYLLHDAMMNDLMIKDLPYEGELPQFIYEAMVPKELYYEEIDKVIANGIAGIRIISFSVKSLRQKLFTGQQYRAALGQLRKDDKVDKFVFHYWLKYNSERKNVIQLIKECSGKLPSGKERFPQEIVLHRLIIDSFENPIVGVIDNCETISILNVN